MLIWALNIALALVVLGFTLRMFYAHRHYTTGPRWQLALSAAFYLLVLDPLVWFMLRAMVGVMLPPY